MRGEQKRAGEKAKRRYLKSERTWLYWYIMKGRRIEQRAGDSDTSGTGCAEATGQTKTERGDLWYSTAA